MNNLNLGFAFDDILLLPGYSEVRRREVDVSSHLTGNIKLEIPFISSPMDTVTEAKLAIALGKVGGFGIIHRNLSIAKQIAEVKRVKKGGVRVGAAVGVGTDLKQRVEKLVATSVDAICVDSGHGLSKSVIAATQWIHTNFPHVQLISGNVATPEGVKRLARAGADAIRVGMGPGSICTTRVMSGMGVPQFTAIQLCVRAARKQGVKIIADGGVKYSGDAVKALAAGADTVMMGGVFASTLEAPGDLVKIDKEKRQVSRISADAAMNRIPTSRRDSGSWYKYYRGMGSVKAMKEGSAARYGQETPETKQGTGQYPAKPSNKSDALNIEKRRFIKSSALSEETNLVPEGVEGLVELKGTVAELMHQFVGGLRAGMYYIGAKNLAELRKKAKFIQITTASLGESHPHSIVITNGGENYQ